MKSLFPFVGRPWPGLNACGWKVAVIIGLALVIYLPALNGGWVMDDTFLIEQNSTLHGATGLWFIWFGHSPSVEWPLTWTFFWIITQVFGLSPWAFHLANLALHLADALLFWSLLARLGLRQAWLGALIFVVHPMMVESVAWMSEIKNTLSLLFYLLAAQAWLDFEEGRGRFRYARTLAFYTAAMLSKTSTVMLPLVLLLYSWWKRRRLELRDWLRMVPFLGVALVLGLGSVGNQRSSLIDPTVIDRSLGARVGESAGAVFFYLGKFLWPAGVSFVYPRWPVDPPRLIDLAMAAVLGAVVVALFLFRRYRWASTGILGFGFFLLNLAPVAGMTDLVYYHISWVADHLAYLPSLGLIGLAAAALEAAWSSLGRNGRVVGLGAFAAAILTCTALSRDDAGLYRSEFAISERARMLHPSCLAARRIYAADLLAAGRFDEGLAELRAIVKDFPDDDEARWKLAEALSDRAATADEADAMYQKFLLQPGLTAMHHVLLGRYLVKVNRLPEAVEQYRLALQMDSSYIDARDDLGYALMNMPGHQDEGLAQYAACLQIDPTDPQTHNNLGYAYTYLHRPDDALAELKLAVFYNPGFVVAHNNLGNAWAVKGAWDKAVAEYQTAMRIDPTDPLAYQSLGYVYGRVFQQWPEAVQQYRTLVKIQPDNVDNYQQLGDALTHVGDETGAARAYQEARRLQDLLGSGAGPARKDNTSASNR